MNMDLIFVAKKEDVEDIVAGKKTSMSFEEKPDIQVGKVYAIVMDDPSVYYCKVKCIHISKDLKHRIEFRVVSRPFRINGDEIIDYPLPNMEKYSSIEPLPDAFQKVFDYLMEEA